MAEGPFVSQSWRSATVVERVGSSWHSLLCLPMENWPSWRGVKGSRVFLYSLLGVCAAVHEWGDRDMG